MHAPSSSSCSGPLAIQPLACFATGIRETRMLMMQPLTAGGPIDAGFGHSSYCCPGVPHAGHARG